LSFRLSPGLEILNEFRRFLSTQVDEQEIIVYYTKVLFEQAARALDAGVHLGTAVLCRSSLENSFFLFLYGRWDRGVFFVDNPKTRNGKRRIVQFEELKRAITKEITFSQNELEAIDRIQDHGNLTAHFASNRIDRTQRWERDLIRETNLLLQKGANPEKWSRLVQRLERNSGIWITPNEALDDLADTPLILRTLLREFARQQAASVSILISR